VFQEVFGEDPYLSGILAAAYVKGMQGNDERFVRTSSGCKVVGVYSGPENIPESRFSFNANVCCILAFHIVVDDEKPTETCFWPLLSTRHKLWVLMEQ